MSEAAAALEQAVEMAPNKARPRRELAHTYLLLERLDEAIAAYRQVLEIRPADIQAHFGLALAYDAQGMTAQAIAEFQIVIETDPEHWLAEQARQELATYEQ
jgi:tetratricopeptide (TPR) repeat protein